MPDWWIRTTDGKQSGPFTEDRLKVLLSSRIIPNDTYCRPEDQPDWQPVAETHPFDEVLAETALENKSSQVERPFGHFFSEKEVTEYLDEDEEGTSVVIQKPTPSSKMAEEDLGAKQGARSASISDGINLTLATEVKSLREKLRAVDVDGWTQKIHAVQNENQHLNEKVSQLELALKASNSKEEALSAIEERNLSLEERNLSLEQEVGQLRQQTEETEKSAQEHSTKVQLLLEEGRRLREEVSRWREDLLASEKKNRRLEDENERVSDAYQVEIENEADKARQLQKEGQQQREEVSQLRTKLQISEDGSKKLDEEIRRIRAEQELLREASTTALATEQSNRAQAAVAFKGQIAERDRRIKALEEQLQQTRSSLLQQLEEEIALHGRTKKEVEKLQAESEENKAKLKLNEEDHREKLAQIVSSISALVGQSAQPEVVAADLLSPPELHEPIAKNQENPATAAPGIVQAVLPSTAELIPATPKTMRQGQQDPGMPKRWFLSPRILVLCVVTFGIVAVVFVASREDSGELIEGNGKVVSFAEVSNLPKAKPLDTALDAQSSRFGKRPENMPCQVVQRYSSGEISNWWSFKYSDSGQLYKAQDAKANVREASAKIRPREQVDREFDQRPWSISYEYDGNGRLMKYTNLDSDNYSVILFTYRPNGLLKHYGGEYGVHKLKRDKLSVVLDMYEMPKVGIVRMRYEHPGTPAKFPVPFVFGRGEVFLGQEKTYIQFPGKPEVHMLSVSFEGPKRAISRVQAMHMDGSRSDYYEFRYSCSRNPR